MLLGVLSFSLAAILSSTVLLPIEVMGTNGTTKSASVNVSSNSALAGPLKLYLQIHGLEYENQASVQVNNGTWISLNNQTVTMPGLAGKYGGIGGGFNTISMTINLPAGLVRAGTNSVNFRFNNTDGNSSGFRVLAFNIQSPAGSSLIAANSFAEDDPASWRAPSTASSDISAGKTLYQTATISQPLPPSSRKTTAAHCGDCHTQDGRDLKYFNYSNNTIYTRAMWHGLNSTQANQIVSYIRTLPTPAPSSARPWNPPYQPGPGLDARGVSQWAAGAGLGEVLASDSQIESYLVPGGSTADWSASYNVNLREMPVAMELPDWNHWLPRVHPKDAWGSAFVGDPYNQLYSAIRSGLVPADSSSYGNMIDNFSQWDLAQSSFLGSRTSNPNWTSTLRTNVYSSALWHMVKLWEINQEFELESMPSAAYGSQTETPSWFGQFAFNTSPNMLHIPSGPGLGNGSEISQNYLAYIWYQVQVIQNSGYHHQVGTVPLDWPYVYGFIKDINWHSSTSGDGRDGAAEAMLQLAWLVKSLQVSSGTPAAGSDGWHMGNNDPSILINSAWGEIWNNTTQETRASLSQAYLQAWLNKVKTFSPQNFYQGGWTSSNYIPSGNQDGQFADKIWAMIPRFRFLGVDPNLTDQIAQWAKTVWPAANWDRDKAASCSFQYAGSTVIQCSSD